MIGALRHGFGARRPGFEALRHPGHSRAAKSASPRLLQAAPGCFRAARAAPSRQLQATPGQQLPGHSRSEASKLFQGSSLQTTRLQITPGQPPGYSRAGQQPPGFSRAAGQQPPGYSRAEAFRVGSFRGLQAYVTGGKEHRPGHTTLELHSLSFSHHLYSNSRTTFAVLGRALKNALLAAPLKMNLIWSTKKENNLD